MLENNENNKDVFGRIGKRWRESIDRVKEYEIREDEQTIGGEFIPDQAVVDMDIAFYVLTTLEQQRSGQVRVGGKTRILILHEDLEICRTLNGTFKDDMEVIMASNGLDGLHRLRATLPDAVVASPTLPHLKGPDLCQLVRAAKEFKELPLYIYGGDDSSQNACSEAGASANFSATKEGLDALQVAFSKNKENATATC